MVLIALTGCGGTYWWLNRLTPDEQIIVGRWEVVVSFLGSSQTIKHIAEYRDDRTEYSGGVMTHWTAKNGLIYFVNDRPFSDKVSDLVERMLGLAKKKEQDIAHYEIIDNNKIILDSQIGAAPMRQVWTRIVDK